MEFHREKREEEDRGVQGERRGSQKERERDLASNQFPKCSLQPGIPKKIHRVG